MASIKSQQQTHQGFVLNCFCGQKKLASPLTLTEVYEMCIKTFKIHSTQQQNLCIIFIISMNFIWWSPWCKITHISRCGYLNPVWMKIDKTVDRASNLKNCVESQIFVIVIFLTVDEFYNLGHIERFYKGALTQKRSFLLVCTTFRSDFHVKWKKSKQIFNSKFFIWRPDQMTWTTH